MKRYALALLAATALSFGANAAHAAPETYAVDPHHANIIWHANHFGFSNPSGHFSVKEGTLVLDEQDPAKSTIDVTIDVSGLATGLPDFDKHLKSPDFLDVEKYPTATFKSTKVSVTGKDTAKVTGDFTLHGVTKPVVLDIKLNKIGMNPISNKKTAGFSGSLVLKRSEFGIDKYVPNVSDEVTIGIELEAGLAQ